MAGSIVSCPNCGARNRVPAAAEGVPRCPSCKKPLPWVVPASEEDFAQVADSSRLPVIVDLWAPWCGPCRQLGPWLQQLAAERPGRLKVVKVNVDENPGLSARFNAQAIPTLVLLKDGKQLSVQRGALPLPQLRSWLDAHA